MNRKLRMVPNTYLKNEDPREVVSEFTIEKIERARKFIATFPEYSVTPLHELKNLAKEIGLGTIYLKDESHRFGLDSFKGLGGAWAMGLYLADRLGRNIDELSLAELVKPETREKLGDITFYTATDGNQGRAIAWVARKFQQKAVVYMPKGSAQIRLDHILAQGADASITDMNYDDSVRYASEMADRNNGVMVQDTAWEGYTDIPLHIMQGYGVMALEAMEQIRGNGRERATHVFLQAGVGSMAGAMQGFIAAHYPDICPTTVIVEPDEANCFYQSAAQHTMINVGGDLRTIMAGLACGEPNVISYDIMRNWSSFFLSLPDYVAGDGMRVLGNPLPGDVRVIAGESGAPPLGALYNIMTDPDLADTRQALGLDENSRVLMFSTEGDTDPVNYRDIVWKGAFSRFD